MVLYKPDLDAPYGNAHQTVQRVHTFVERRFLSSEMPSNTVNGKYKAGVTPPIIGHRQKKNESLLKIARRLTRARLEKNERLGKQKRLVSFQEPFRDSASTRGKLIRRAARQSSQSHRTPVRARRRAARRPEL